MKIKRRLFISNTMMIVIPVAVSMLISYLVLFIFSGSSDNPMDKAFPRAFELIWQFQSTGDEQGLIQGVRDFNEAFRDEPVFMAVTRAGELVFPARDSADGSAPDDVVRIAGLLPEDIAGNITVNDARFVIEDVGDYRIVIANRQYRRPAGGMGFLGRVSPLYVASVIGGMLAVILLTNRLLTRLLSRGITKSLDTLAAGAHQLRDGNLDFRISYKNNDEFAPVCDAFNDMAGHLEELILRQQKDETSRKELMAGISHDLRTPLTSIRAYVEGLMDGVADDAPTRRKYLGIIRAKAGDIDNIVDKLFLFSKLDIGEFPLYLQKLDVGEELAAMAETAAEDYGPKGMTVTLSGEREGLYAEADPVQLRNVLANILENSLKYTDKPQVAVTVSCGRTTGAVAVRIADDGPGVPEQELEKIFDVFYRGDPSRRNPGEGSGLGLAITSKILSRMGGSIRAENLPGGGLCMILTLPSAEAR